MTDTYNQLKNELQVLYPDFMDTDLNEMTYNLIDFYKTAVKAVLNSENNQIEKLVVNDKISGT